MRCWDSQQEGQVGRNGLPIADLLLTFAAVYILSVLVIPVRRVKRLL